MSAETGASTSSGFLATKPATAKNARKSESDKRPVHPGSMPTDFLVTNLDFDVTENCNLGCVYCFKGDMYAQNMSLDTMKRAFQWLIDASGPAKSVNCNFMGGEPTMRYRQLREFVPWARSWGATRGKAVTFSMTSNLTLWTEELREFVDRYGFGILMSIDGCPEVQDAQRPSKNGKRVSETVEYWAKSLLKTRPKSQARATLHPDYVEYFHESILYLRSLGFVEVAVSASEYHLWTPRHFELLDHQLDLVVDTVEQGILDGGEFNITAFKYYINSLIRHRQVGNLDAIEWQPQPCGAGKGYMMVDYTGDIWPCHRFDGADEAAGADGQFRLGNIYEEGFNTPLQKAFVSFDHFKQHKESCETCPVNPVCGGYCPAANLSDSGSIYTPHDAFCQWSQGMYAKAEELFSRIASSGEDNLQRLLTSCTKATGTGEK